MPTYRAGEIMDLLWLFFNLKGRISRKTFLLSFLALEGARILFTVALAQLMNISWHDYWEGTQDSAALDLLVYSLFTWPWLAIAFKRLHDIDHSGWRSVVVGALIILAGLQDYMGINQMDLTVDPFYFVQILLTLVLWFWLLFEMIFLKGVAGENIFGPDPLLQKKETLHSAV